MPLVDLANPGQSQLAKQLTGPFGDYLPDNGNGRDTRSAKYFVEHSYPETIQQGGDGVTNLDDPTYLGFDIHFLQDSPLFAPESDKNSAVAYLTQVDTTRAEYLKFFIHGIQKINKERPWYFQTIEGVSTLWEKNAVNPKDPYAGTTGEDGITIGCLEAIDLKITALFSLYRLACYDTKYRRIVLPINLRYFDLNLRILEIRKFKQARAGLQAALTKANNKIFGTKPEESLQSALAYVNDNTSAITFKLTECEWDYKSGAKVFDTVTNVGGEYASTSIKFHYGNISEDSQFSGLDTALKGNFKAPMKDPGTFKDVAKNAAKTFAKDQIANVANQGLNSVERAASGFVQGLALGNVYGERNKVFAAVSNPVSLVNSLNGAGVQAAQATGAGSPITLTDVGGNILPPNVPVSSTPGGSLESTNILGEAPPQQELESTQIFEQGIQPSNSLPTDRQFPAAFQPANKDGSPPPSIPGNDNALGEPQPGPGPLDPNNIFDG